MTYSDPIDPEQTDAAAGSVYTGERRGMMRWTPKWGGKPSLLDWLIVGPIVVVTAVVVVLWFF